MESDVRLDIDPRGIATVTLDRPRVRNAFGDAMVAELDTLWRRLGTDPDVRVVVVRGAGPAFCAGADLAWMRRIADYGRAENLADAAALSAMLDALYRCSKPTVAVVHGPAFGGGVGLVAACDIAIAADTAVFGLSEVRLGLIPATIGPYVLAAIGERASRHLMLTGENFDAAEAWRLGLLHKVVPAAALEQAVDDTLSSLLTGGPAAQTAAKRLIAAVAGEPIDAVLRAGTVSLLADLRASPEGHEGIAAFLERRPPQWRTNQEEEE